MTGTMIRDLVRWSLALALLLGTSTRSSVAAPLSRSSQPYPHYGPIPANCPAPVPIEHINRGINHAFGTSPLWIGPFSVNDREQIHLGNGQNAQYEKAIWQVGPQLNKIITIRGWNLATGKPVKVARYQETPRPVRRINPREDAYMRDKNPRRLLFYGGYLIFPSSGCYVLVARWRNDAELYPFAVGR
jgi:hypothetical protein